ncbi:hypothetical protein [Chromobacterium sphagni]|uniref:Uncharacterized protein n=2 Tax=Chromobacterium sphagni TaxID=1903179 RepID=A0A1S1WZ23_9NEIS|nr:hypothetical protein [Chromobacterium sphagni]OHX12557.1 hypothetical protein BI347_02850 [Chromobacterium sphagni]OHX21358.1 hypothetical protein BI344_02155 [Chromobacterium sphagni]
MQDQATWLVFNLPENVVCTLCNNVVQNANPADFSNAGVCVDLIGNGQTQTIDLKAYGANDCLSGGIWREVDSDQGWFQLFYDINESGTFATIFLSEWSTAKPISIAKWWLQDQASSLNFPCLTPPQQLTLSDNADGSGQSMTVGASNPFGSWNTQAAVNLTDSGMNDKVSSFTYSLVSPVKTVISSVSVNVAAQIVSGQTFTETISGTNASSEVLTLTDTVAVGKSVQISNTTTQQYETTASISATVTATEGVPDVDSIQTSLTASFSVTQTTSSSQTTSTTNSVDLQQQITFNVPPHSSYSGIATIAIGQVPPTTVTQTGSFYYKQNLPGSIKQSDGTYLLTMPITVTINGEVGSSVQFNITSTPLNLA